MPYSYKIHRCPEISVAKMLSEKAKGTPIMLTSHPGNASLYKQSLWVCGIPESLWDVTCVRADKNNQPAYILRAGKKIDLLDGELLSKIETETSPDRRYVTAYQYAKNGDRLSRIHIRAMQKYFEGQSAQSERKLSSQSRLMLEHRENVQLILEYLANKDPKFHFPRRIDSNGIMSPYDHRDGLSGEEVASSCINVFTELEKLLFSDNEIVTSGGIVYGFPLIPIIVALCGYWSSENTTRYDVSGPDMIHYATTSKYQESLSALLEDLHRNFPQLAPKRFDVYMPNGVIFRTGNRVIGDVVDERFDVLCNQILNQQLIRRGKLDGKRLGDEEYDRMKSEAKNLHSLKPFSINSSVDNYHSQHDDGIVVVPEMFVNMPFSQIEERTLKLRSILRI